VKNTKYIDFLPVPAGFSSAGLTKTCQDSWGDQGRQIITFQESLTYMLQYRRHQQQSYDHLCFLHTVCKKLQVKITEK